MGIFNFFKKKNKIELDFDVSTEPLFVYPSKKIKLPNTAVVGENMEMFFCDGGKVLDHFTQGEHLINIATLPNCDKRFKLSKPDTDGKLASWFYCNTYYVNKSLFTYKKWKSYRKAEINDGKVGEFSVGLSGGYAFKIVDAKKFVEMMLKEYDIIKNKEAEKILSGYVGEYVLSFVEKRKINLEQLLDKAKLIDDIFNTINEKLDFLGVEFLGFNIEKISLPKHLKVIKENICEETETGENVFEKKVKQNLDKKFWKKDRNNKHNEILTNKQQISQDELLYFGRKNSQNESLENDNAQNNKKAQDMHILQAQVRVETDTEQKNIRCLFCGFENKVGDEKCAICGQTLKRKGKVL